jgi:prepilin-type N-terminal cleavage/methylation domain-containing protein
MNFVTLDRVVSARGLACPARDTNLFEAAVCACYPWHHRARLRRQISDPAGARQSIRQSRAARMAALDKGGTMRRKRDEVPSVGFSLIELLVVIAVIGVLVALTLPAVQSAREAARRTQCQNNLKEHGLALNNYVTLSEAYPIGYVAWRNPPGGAAPGWAWSAAILPQLEQGPIYDALNVKLPVDFADNVTVRTSSLAIYVCPSDGKTGAFNVLSQLTGGPVEARTTSYAANGGTDGPSQGNGMFRMNKSVRPKDVKDGLSNTFAAGERGSYAVQNAWAGALGDGRGAVEVLAIVSTSDANPTNPSPATFCGAHMGLTQFLMADGSVHPIKATINPAVYRALATRSAREVIDQGTY